MRRIVKVGNSGKYQGEWFFPKKVGKEYVYETTDIDGRGIFIRRDGYRYDGFFKRGRRNGPGREILVDWHSAVDWMFHGEFDMGKRLLDASTLYFFKTKHQQILDNAWEEAKKLIDPADKTF